jgi:hypothetical protein
LAGGVIGYDSERASLTFCILIFSSETTGPIGTKLGKIDGAWVVPFQNCIRWSRSQPRWLPLLACFRSALSSESKKWSLGSINCILNGFRNTFFTADSGKPLGQLGLNLARLMVLGWSPFRIVSDDPAPNQDGRHCWK